MKKHSQKKSPSPGAADVRSEFPSGRPDAQVRQPTLDSEGRFGFIATGPRIPKCLLTLWLDV